MATTSNTLKPIRCCFNILTPPVVYLDAFTIAYLFRGFALCTEASSVLRSWMKMEVVVLIGWVSMMLMGWVTMVVIMLMPQSTS